MENIGTWNSDLLFIFTAALLLPIVWHFVNEILDIMRGREPDTTETKYAIAIERIETTPEPKRTPPPKRSSVTRKVKPSITTKPKPKATPKPKTTSKPKATPKPKATSKPKKKTPPQPKHSTSSEVTQEAIQGLMSLGFRKKEATDTVRGFLKDKSYKDSGSIIQDVFGQKS
tara:strand:+ start:333 stop:848 length:516 start_codon:yes stop_codon:yes gene_type:complete